VKRILIYFITHVQLWISGKWYRIKLYG